MISKKAILLLCVLSHIVGCTYNAKTKKTRFTPLGAGPHEIIDTVARDVKECSSGSSDSCKTKTAHDGYEESKFKSMTNEELDDYVKKMKLKNRAD
jgi:hypothetical protein